MMGSDARPSGWGVEGEASQDFKLLDRRAHREQSGKQSNKLSKQGEDFPLGLIVCGHMTPLESRSKVGGQTLANTKLVKTSCVQSITFPFI